MQAPAEAPVKDPKAVRRGTLGARARWGPPRVVRLDALEAPIRAAILALVEADRAAQTEKTGADIVIPAPAVNSQTPDDCS